MMSRTTLLIHASLLAWVMPLAAADAAEGEAQSASPSAAGALAAPQEAASGSAAATRPTGKAKKTKEKAAKRATGKSDAGTGNNGDVIVTGIRSSLARARQTKRDSKAIVDVVDAEDIGKLPYNTLGDVVASIPGVSVTREEGEVSSIRLRGLDDVQTTIGGTPVESGIGRTATIQDLPADLVASIQVFKTRTPDQVEGAGAGSINVVLRKPVDFKTGLTVSANASARYNQQVGKFNTTYTGVFNYRADTAIGGLGAQLGITVNTNPVLESAAWNYGLQAVQTRQVVGPQILPLPTFGPSAVAFRYNNGIRTTPSVNASLQWTPDPETSIVVEGNYARPYFDYFTNWLEPPVLAQAASTNNLPALSNLVLVPGTNRLASATVAPVTQFGPTNWNQRMVNDTLLLKLTANRNTEQYDLSTEIAYTRGNFKFDEIRLLNRFVNRPTYDVEFASDKYRYPMMNLEFHDLDLLDPQQYRFYGASEYALRWKNQTLSTRADLTLRTFWDPIQYIKVGFRYADRRASRREFRREVYNLELPLSAMPAGYDKLYPMSEGFKATGVENNARWLTYDRFAVRDHFDDLRQLLARYSPAFAAPANPEQLSRRFTGDERSMAAYGTLGYGTKLLIPIDGIVGARITNTIVDNRSVAFVTRRRLVNGVLATVTDLEPRTGIGNYLNIEPTATAVLHFTPRLQTRLSYNVGIRRPNVDQISPFITINDTNQTASGGNPALQPERTVRYDAIVEYYFGKVGLITINPFYWKTQGSFAWFETLELLDEGDTDLTRVWRPYNAGRGFRRGVELQGQMFFRFLPGILKNFGVSSNFTYVDGEQNFDKVPNSTNAAPATVPLINVAKYTYNAAALFERGSLNARLSYNYNGSFLLNIASPIANSRYIAPRDWMDAAINYTITHGPLTNLGFSVQVQNVLASVRRTYYGYPDQPESTVYMARTYGGTVRYRF